MSGLEAMIADFQGLADGFTPDVARRASPLVEQALKASAAAGTTPEGQAWAPKKTGGRAMPNAAKAIAVKAFPTVVRVVLTGVEVFGHYGKGAMQVARKIIPDTGAMPKVVAEALKRASDEAFAKFFGGAR